ncbi:MAG: type II toxin-antitoxin system VapC family toxin, partial [Acidobacteriota bacterium]
IRLVDVSVHVPHLLDLEIAQTLRRYVRTGSLPAARGKLALEHLRQLDFVRHRHDLLLSRIWRLRHNLTAYDAVYLALAEVLGATLLTADRALAKVPTRVPIDLLEKDSSSFPLSPRHTR